MMWNDGNWGATSWLAIALTLLTLLWIDLAVMVVRQTRNSHARSTGTSGVQMGATSRSDEILAEQFVSGEIDEAEFIRRRQALHNNGGRSGRGDQR